MSDVRPRAVAALTWSSTKSLSASGSEMFIVLTSVTLTDLKPGAQVEILQSGVSLGIGQAPEQTTFDFPTPALVGGTMITARQTLRAQQSVESNAVPVDPAPNTLPQPVVPRPLHECGAAVRVTNVHVGARVYVFSTLLGAEIGDTPVQRGYSLSEVFAEAFTTLGGRDRTSRNPNYVQNFA